MGHKHSVRDRSSDQRLQLSGSAGARHWPWGESPKGFHLLMTESCQPRTLISRFGFSLKHSGPTLDFVPLLINRRFLFATPVATRSRPGDRLLVIISLYSHAPGSGTESQSSLCSDGWAQRRDATKPRRVREWGDELTDLEQDTLSP